LLGGYSFENAKMGTIAKSSITLTSISDAYSVSMTPNSCVIHADYDGSNPQLERAYTILSVMCGDEKALMSADESNVVLSNDEITYSLVKIDDYSWKLSITGLPLSLLDGYIEVSVNASVDLVLTACFPFSVVRESTMLDWIQDWEGGKTKIGDSYVITPKIFVGKKITGDHSSLSDVDGLTGVYIGPANDDSAGVYGYKAGVEIFHLDETGGSIGGWDINDGGIQTEDGTLQLLSEGSIIAKSEGVVHWALYKDGSGYFADGNVQFDADGNASFKGSIEATGGVIGGWHIGTDRLYNMGIGLNSANQYIAIANVTARQDSGNEFSWVQDYGGVAMFYASSNYYGFVGYKGSTKTFSAGSDNYIAGWSFDGNALYLGTKNNNASQYTSASGSITIGTNGLRGYKWYINTDGTASFVGGYVQFGQTSGKIAGWTFTGESLYNGVENTTAGEFTTASGYITMSTTGLRGYKWRLESDGSAAFSGGKILFNSDGSGQLAGGMIKWGTDGSGSLASGNIYWDASGNTVFKGTIGGWKVTENAITKNDVSLGSDGTISNGSYWSLNSDGSGQLAGGMIKWGTDGSGSLASGNIYWDASGNTVFKGTIGGWKVTENAITKNDVSLGSDGTISNGSYWSLNSDGSGQLAGGMIKWGTDGSGSLASGNIYWDASGNTVFKGTIGGWKVTENAITKNDVSLGSDGTISNGSYWSLNSDGSGQLATSMIKWNTDGSGSLSGGKIVWNKDGSGSLCGKISWDKDGNITFADTVTAQWQNGIDAAQLMAYAKMLYRDPEFASGGFNGTSVYLDGNQYVTFSAGLILTTLTAYGLMLRGTGYVRLIDFIDSSGNVSTVWSGYTRLDATALTSFVTATNCSSLTNSYTIRVWIAQLDASNLQLQTASKVSDSNGNFTYTYYNLFGYSSDIATSYIDVVRTLATDSTAPNSTQKVMKIVDYNWYGESDFRLGGFYFANQSRANAKFVVKMVAKIPTGWYLDNAHNAYGTGSKTTWVTSKFGTGAYTEYICIVQCGSSGTFSTVNHFSLRRQSDDTSTSSDTAITYTDYNGTKCSLSSLTWYVAYVTVYDASSSDKLTTAIDVNGIYTGTLRADQIIAGTIDADNITVDTVDAAIIKNGDAWALNKDGSGYLANKNISWDTEGNLTIKGTIYAQDGYIGGFKIGDGYIGAANVSTDSDGKITVVTDHNGLFLYDTMIGFNAKNRQAILGAWNNYGTNILVRLVDTTSDYGSKYGIVFDIENNTLGSNFAFAGKGVGVLNGMIEGYAFKKLSITKSNTRYSGAMSLLTANRFLVSCSVSGSGILLPLLSDVRNALGVSDTTAFCVKITICAELNNSQQFTVYGRNSDQSSEKDSDGNYKKPWNTTNYPLFVNENSGNQSSMAMGTGDILEILLVYDPDRTDTINDYDTKYTARIISRYN